MLCMALFALFLLGAAAQNAVNLPALGVATAIGPTRSICYWGEGPAGPYGPCVGVVSPVTVASNPFSSSWVVAAVGGAYVSRSGKTFAPCNFTAPFTGPSVNIAVAAHWYVLITATDIYTSVEGSSFTPIPNPALPAFDPPAVASQPRTHIAYDEAADQVVIAGSVNNVLVIWSASLSSGLANAFVFNTGVTVGTVRGMMVDSVNELTVLALDMGGNRTLALYSVGYQRGRTSIAAVLQRRFIDPFAALCPFSDNSFILSFDNVAQVMTTAGRRLVQSTSPSQKIQPTRIDYSPSWTAAILSGFDSETNQFALYYSVGGSLGWVRSFSSPFPVSGVAARQFLTGDIAAFLPTFSGIINGSAVVANNTVVGSGTMSIVGDLVQLRNTSFSLAANLSVSGTTAFLDRVSTDVRARVDTKTLILDPAATLTLTGTVSPQSGTTTETFTVATFASIETAPNQPVNVGVSLTLPPGVTVVSSQTTVGSTSLTVAVTFGSSGLSTAAFIGIIVGSVVGGLVIIAAVVGATVLAIQSRKSLENVQNKVNAGMSSSEYVQLKE